MAKSLEVFVGGEDKCSSFVVLVWTAFSSVYGWCISCMACEGGSEISVSAGCKCASLFDSTVWLTLILGSETRGGKGGGTKLLLMIGLDCAPALLCLGINDWGCFEREPEGGNLPYTQ